MYTWLKGNILYHELINKHLVENILDYELIDKRLVENIPDNELINKTGLKTNLIINQLITTWLKT